MNKLLKIILAIFGGCDVVIRLMTPIAVVLFWGFWFGYTDIFFKFLLVVGGFSTLLRAIKIATAKNNE